MPTTNLANGTRTNIPHALGYWADVFLMRRQMVGMEYMPTLRDFAKILGIEFRGFSAAPILGINSHTRTCRVESRLPRSKAKPIGCRPFRLAVPH